MKQRSFQEVKLTDLQTNPHNPRKHYSGPKFEELVASIRQVGVIEPILIRPVINPKDSGAKPTLYEIVAGERRYRASCSIQSGAKGAGTIPAIIQNMTDDEAFDLMTIENLQREDLTELEEAQSFKIYLDKKGKEALPELAERTGINPNYIRRRMTVLALPKEALKAWEAGKIKYGHCEQLCRVKDKTIIQELLGKLLHEDRYYGQMTVKDLKEEIDDDTISLGDAKFDLEKAGCTTCQANSDVQRTLFNEAMEEKHCTNEKCFKDKQEIWLKENWKKLCKKHGTNGFRFWDTVDYSNKHYFYQHAPNPGEKCKDCQFFVSLFGWDCKINQKQVCIGDKSCFNSIINAGKAAQKKKEKTAAGNSNGEQVEIDTDATETSWHATAAIEAFYKETIPGQITALTSEHEIILRLSLMALLIHNGGALEKFVGIWMNDKYSLGDDGELLNKEGEEISPFDVSENDIFNRLIAMPLDYVIAAHKEVAGEVIVHDSILKVRHGVARHLGIDLASEWRLNKDYLDKKTTKEILDLIDRLSIGKDEKALAYLQENLNKKRGRFDTCKKGELIALILESGVDLTGKVPAEILQAVKELEEEEE